MTREEAIKDLIFVRAHLDDNSQIAKSYDIAIKALEQEPCSDAISRQAVLEKQYRIDDSATLSTRDVVNVDDIEDLPSVKPQEPKWIPVSKELPEDGTWNLFTDGKNVSVERYKADALDHFYPNGRWFSLDDAIAWMPLPERYKAESEGEE